MVNTSCYPGDVRRYSGRMATYPSYPERRASAYPIHPESRTSSFSDKDGMDEVTPQRKRIAVACGRCRKRKIRCSGDPGNGGPCSNCKNAGFEPCQFLRVASQETMMKNDAFTYSLEASRQYQARGPTAVPPLATVGQYQEALSIPASDPLAYRQSSTSFTYSKPYYPMSGWPNGLPDDQPVSYPIYGPSYHSIQEPEYTMSYRIGPGAPVKASSALYVDAEPSYTYGSGPSNTLVQRSTGTDSPFAYQNVAHGLISSVNSSERVLPTPIGRMLPSSGASPYRHDSTASTYSKGSQSSASGGSPTTPNSDVPSGYTNYEPSSLSSYPPTTLATQFSRSNDLYSTTGSSDGIYSESLRTSGSAPDLQYRYTDTTTRKDSTSSALTLSHSSTYVPQSHGHGHGNVSYMLSGDVGSGAAETASETHRNGAGALRA